MARFFRRRRNRACVYFEGIGLVPVACEDDDVPMLLTQAPRRIGDDVLVLVEGKTRRARLLRCREGATFLVDMGRGIA